MNRAVIDSAGAGRGTFKSYAAGFFLSIVLTAIAFGLVMQGAALSRGTVLAGILSAGSVQILVHLYYFLHLNTTSSARWNVLALVFTLLIMILFVGGSLWIMTNLHYRMM